jgi:hypothetical protein
MADAEKGCLDFEGVGTYEGFHKRGSPQGMGEFTFNNGHRYEGNFNMGQKNNNGTYYFSPDKFFVGEFENDKRSGTGTFYDKAAGVISHQKYDDDVKV